MLRVMLIGGPSRSLYHTRGALCTMHVYSRMLSTHGEGKNKDELPHSVTHSSSSSSSTSPSTTAVANKAAWHVRVWKRVKEEARHYWSGTKLLASNMRISAHFLRRLARGDILSRREKKLLEQTVADTIRLMPFIVIAVVPFLEFSLPFLLKIFPNMLPSTYTTQEQEKGKRNAALQIRLKMANFLKSATARMLDEESHTPITEDAARAFLEKAATGTPVTNAEIIRVGKLLKEEFALDRIGREELQAVARFFGVSTYPPTSYIVWQLERKLKELRRDDMMIAAEGMEKLTMEELVQANFARGMRVEGRTRDQLEQQLEDWMELADSDDVPPFLLLLSRSFTSPKTQDIAIVAKGAFEKLAKSERVELLLDTLPDDDLVNRAKMLEANKSGDALANDLRVTFATVDKDGDGKIVLFELKDLMTRLGESFAPEQLDMWLRKADTNGDGQIDFQEFVALMREAMAEEESQSSMLDVLRKRVRDSRNEIVVLEESAGGADKVIATIDKMLAGVEQELLKEEEASRAAKITLPAPDKGPEPELLTKEPEKPALPKEEEKPALPPPSATERSSKVADKQ